MTKYVKQFSIDPHSVDIHDIANLTPIMTDLQFEALVKSIREEGQLEPAKFYRGKLIDGRHRLKAAKQLGLNLNYTNSESIMSIEDVTAQVVGLETRRHQTATQKAIFAYREYTKQKSKDSQTTQGDIAETFGTTRQHMGRVKKLLELTDVAVVELLFNGKKIKIDGKDTDNLNTIVRYFTLMTKKIVEDSEAANKHLDMTDDENSYIREILDNIEANHGAEFMQALAQQAHARGKSFS